MRPSLLVCLLALSAAAQARAWHDGETSDRERPLVQALQTVGVKYRLGGRSPETGLDCSGLVAYVFERAWGVMLPPSAAALSKVGMPVRKLHELQPGDLVFYNTRNRPHSHVGIYLGEGRFLHAPRTGAKVRVENTMTPYWRQRFDGARRLDPPTF
jgi:cell wall-associated NlpC family hydrolase